MKVRLEISAHGFVEVDVPEGKEDDAKQDIEDGVAYLTDLDDLPAYLQPDMEDLPNHLTWEVEEAEIIENEEKKDA